MLRPWAISEYDFELTETRHLNDMLELVHPRSKELQSSVHYSMRGGAAD
jgi:hypothetical protein